MDERALNIVRQYIEEHLDKSDKKPQFEVFIVWKAKVLQNWKYLISSTLYDGMYYELTYNGDRNEWYLDAYKKFENRVVPIAEQTEPSLSDIPTTTENCSMIDCLKCEHNEHCHYLVKDIPWSDCPWKRRYEYNRLCSIINDNDRRKWFFCKKCNRWQLLEIHTVNNCKYCGNVLLAWMK